MPDSLILKEKAEQPQPFPLFFGKIAKSLLKFVTPIILVVFGT